MTIFVSIASYEDPTLIRTIRSAIDNARFPNDITFGLGLQYKNTPDLSFIEHQTKSISWDVDSRPGIAKIRYEISKLYTNQDYYLQIDSHVVFEKDWDITLIAALKKAEAMSEFGNVILLPLNYYGNEVMTSSWKIEFHNNPVLPFLFTPQPVNGRKIPVHDIEEISFTRVGQVFFKGSFITDVGLDPYTQIEQEPAYLSFRAYIAGWSLFQFHSNVITQDDAEYLRVVWNNSSTKKLGGKDVREAEDFYVQMCMAYLYNDKSIYAIKNYKKTPLDFWKLNNQTNEYYKALELANNYFKNDIKSV